MIVLSPATLTVAAIVLVWVVQPLVMHLLIIYSSSRWLILFTIITFASSTFTLARLLHLSLTITVKPLFFIVLWYPLAMQFMRYLHALSVGIQPFVDHFGLTDFSRVFIFMMSPPSVQFRNSKKLENNCKAWTVVQLKDYQRNKKNIVLDDDKNKNYDKMLKDVKIIFLDILITISMCGLVLLLKLDVFLPDFLQRLIRIYIMGFSTSILKFVLECPVKYCLRNDPRVARIVPIYDRPYLSTPPRDLWHRWSVTAGYHLRKAFYEPAQGFQNNKIVAAALPFGVNCLLHMYWWSMAIKGDVDFSYCNLLFLYPLISFFVQDLIYCVTKKRPILRMGGNLMVLWVGFYAIGEEMASAHGLKSSLTGVCRSNLGLPLLD